LNVKVSTRQWREHLWSKGSTLGKFRCSGAHPITLALVRQRGGGGSHDVTAVAVLRWSPMAATGFCNKEGQDQSAGKRLEGGAHRRGVKVAAVAPIPLASTYLRWPTSDKKQKGKEGGGGARGAHRKENGGKGERGRGGGERRGGPIWDAPHGGRNWGGCPARLEGGGRSKWPGRGACGRAVGTKQGSPGRRQVGPGP
jgi:hypothetical protein